MKQIRIIVEKSRTRYSSYAENLPGIYGGGDTAEEAINSAITAIEIMNRHRKANNTTPLLKGKYKITYQFDASSLLNYYRKFFTNAALERMTGIHQKQIQHYTSGLKKPRNAQAKKFEHAFRQLGSELTELKLRIS